jgi:hypothetical protein
VDESPADIVNHWVHSHEEDTPGVEVYRPAGYPFPPSRGRRGFDLRAGGQLIYNGIGKTDTVTTAKGNWSAEGSNRIRFQFDDEGMASQLFEIVSKEAGILKVRRTRA